MRPVQPARLPGEAQAKTAAKARAIHSPTLRLQQNPRSPVFFRVPISSVRSVKLRLGGEKNPFPARKDLRVSSMVRNIRNLKASTQRISCF